MSGIEHTMQAYVHASAALLELPLAEGQAERVSAHLQRTAAMAGRLQAYALAPHDEPAQVYCPAPFPALPAAPSLPGTPS